MPAAKKTAKVPESDVSPASADAPPPLTVDEVLAAEPTDEETVAGAVDVSFYDPPETDHPALQALERELREVYRKLGIDDGFMSLSWIGDRDALEVNYRLMVIDRREILGANWRQPDANPKQIAEEAGAFARKSLIEYLSQLVTTLKSRL